MEDRFVRYFIAGIISALFMNLWDYFSYYILHLSTMRLLDYASVMLLGKKVFIFWEEIFAQLTQIFFTGMMGVLFGYLITKINSKYYLFKSWLFAVSVWFVVFAIGSLFKMPYLYKVPTQTSLNNFLESSIYGLALAQTTIWLDSKLNKKLNS